MTELSQLGGPIALKKFGMFRTFVQTLVNNTRDKVCTCRRQAMLGAFRAITGDTLCEFTGIFDINVIFSKRKYKTQLKN